ncbi:hypothetical protein MWU76_21460 [Gelidibacter sp. F2691]|nr:hypothetical protein [Gelidibacter sp. F2691]
MKQIRTPLTGTPLVLPQATHPCGEAQVTPLHPADELAQIRAELSRLHQREDELRRFFREDALDTDLVGTTHSVSVIQHKKREFDPAKLPQAILANRKYHREERRTLITTSPISDAVCDHSVPQQSAQTEKAQIAGTPAPDTRLI